MTTAIIYVPPFKKMHRNDERYYFTLWAGLACRRRGADREWAGYGSRRDPGAVPPETPEKVT
jgi:hypothetical protein